jgi:hypothetical protein
MWHVLWQEQRTRVARFFSGQYTKIGKTLYQTTMKLPYGHKIYQMAVKYSQWREKYASIFHSKALQNIPKLILGQKYGIWQPCSP